MNDELREKLILEYVQMATACVRVTPLARFYIDKAKRLINGRSLEQIARMERQRGLR